jgi:trans-2,3-dihydro-3-hydroxyanthranilate isomerase
VSEVAFTICDVFTDRPFAGNQLAVFLDGPAIPEPLLQPLAREINFAETVFVYPPAAGGTARMRIFTPAVELPFAGHPVLGTAIVVGAARQAPSVVLETGLGAVPVALESMSARRGFGRMRQPVPTVAAFPEADRLLAALGVAQSRLPVEVYDNGPRHVFVALDGEEAVSRLRPDLSALSRLGRICANCFGGAGRRWRTRMFAPSLGVSEDPATGSAAGPLAWHLARHGLVPFGDEIEISQGSEIGRPSALFARAVGSSSAPPTIEVAGAAVIVGRGAFQVDAVPV